MSTPASYETHEHDVIVIGAGGAGLRAAVEAAAQGVSVGLVCKSLLGKAHTVMAEGGIAAALGNVWPEDNWEVHFRDTMRGGKMLNNWRMAQLHAQEAPERVLELERWGALFDRTKDGRILQRDFGGQIDWGQVYGFADRREAISSGLGWEVGRWLDAPRILGIVEMQDVDLGGGYGEHREVGVIAVLEVSVVAGDPEAVEFRDQETRELVLRLEATDPALPAEQLVTAAESCDGFFGCPLSVWRLFVDAGGGAWVDPPWTGIPVDQVAVGVGAEGFVIVAVGRSEDDPSPSCTPGARRGGGHGRSSTPPGPSICPQAWRHLGWIWSGTGNAW